MHLVARVLLASLLALVGPDVARADDTHAVVVGRMHRAYVDEARSHWSGQGPRPLVATVWYPAAPGSNASDWSIGVFRFGRTALDAPVARGEPRPLVILSHGTGGTAAQLSWLAEALVAGGFVVAAVNHHGNTAAEERPWPHGFVLPGERARDVPVLIDRLLADPALAPHIDPARIGVAGFSIGGYTALAAVGAHLPVARWEVRCQAQPDNPVCQLPPEAGFTIADLQALKDSDPVYQAAAARDAQPVRDPRIRAAYAIAPAFISLAGEQDLAGVQVPARVVLAGQDTQIVLEGTRQVLAEHLPQASLRVVPEAGHYAFLALCDASGPKVLAALCTDPGPLDRAEIHRQVGEDAVGFFRAQL